MRQEVEHVFPGRQVDRQVVPFGRRDLRDPPLHQGLSRRDELDHGRTAGIEVGLDRANERGTLHGAQEVAEEALLGALEGGERRRLRVPVQRLLALRDPGGLECVVQVGVDDLEGACVGVVDAPLLGTQRVFQDVHLDPLIRQCPRLVEAQGLQVPGDHLHGGDAARLHRRHEVPPPLEGRLACAPETQPYRVGESGHGGGARGRDVEDPGAWERVLEPETRPSLGGGFHLAARSPGTGGVGHGVGLVEDDHALIAVAVLLTQAPGQPGDDLVEP